MITVLLMKLYKEKCEISAKFLYVQTRKYMKLKEIEMNLQADFKSDLSQQYLIIQRIFWCMMILSNNYGELLLKENLIR